MMNDLLKNLPASLVVDTYINAMADKIYIYFAAHTSSRVQISKKYTASQTDFNEVISCITDAILALKAYPNDHIANLLNSISILPAFSSLQKEHRFGYIISLKDTTKYIIDMGFVRSSNSKIKTYVIGIISRWLWNALKWRRYIGNGPNVPITYSTTNKDIFSNTRLYLRDASKNIVYLES